MNSWEYDTQLRPWLLPLIFAFPLKILDLLNADPFLSSSIIRLISGIVSWFAIVRFISKLNFKFNQELKIKVITLLLHFTFFIKFMQFRSNSENWATSFFLLSISFLLDSKSKKSLVFSSLLAGVSFLLRHQLGLMILPMYLNILILRQVSLKSWITYAIIPILSTMLIGLGIDSFGYGELSYSPWNYVYQNLILGKVNNFGVSPIYAYLKWTIIKLTPFFGLPLLYGLYYYLRNKTSSLLLWSIVPFILVHHLIGHKEFRFLFPVLPILIVMACDSLIESRWFNSLRNSRTVKVIWYLNLTATLIVSLKVAYTPMKFYRHAYFAKYEKLLTFPDRKGNHPTLEMPFYKRKNVTLKKSSFPIESAKGALFTTKFKELDVILKRKECTVKFSSYPLKVLEFNFFNWVNRSNIWAISICK